MLKIEAKLNKHNKCTLIPEEYTNRRTKTRNKERQNRKGNTKCRNSKSFRKRSNTAIVAFAKSQFK